VPNILDLPFAFIIVVTTVIGFAGTRLAAVADELAVRTGLGESLVGAVLVGASQSVGCVRSLHAPAY